MSQPNHGTKHTVSNKDLPVPEWFNFNGNVPEKFDSHVSKSVPNYSQVIDMIGWVSGFFIEKNSTIVDLGCSTGAVTRKILDHNHGKPLSVTGVDASPEMIEACSGLVKNHDTYNKDYVNFHAEVLDMEHPDSFSKFTQTNLFVSSLFLQFTRTTRRQAILNQIYSNLTDGGAFLWYEKCLSEFVTSEIISKQYMDDHKSKSGIPFESIYKKDSSLRGIMQCHSLEKNLDMLKKAGFEQVSILHKEVNFTLILAVK